MGEGSVDDDSACHARIAAHECGLFAPAYCNGQRDQRDPICAARCVRDGDCAQNAHCQRGACIENRPDGERCVVDLDCQSGHCNRGLCCGPGGTCCLTDAECASSNQAARCDRPAECQGTRREASCVDHACDVRVTEDDSACDRRLRALRCDDGRELFCTGDTHQPMPSCFAQP